MTPLPPSLSYRQRQLWMDGVSLTRLANEVGTPAYVYSRDRLLENFERFDGAFEGIPHLVLFAVKSNSSAAVISLFGKAGAGSDIVSRGELERALRAGVPANRIVFSGVGKRADEIQLALDAGILMFNVESEEELHAINRVATARRKAASIAIRVNPDVDAMTHDHITTGKKENKFGIPIEKAQAVFVAASKLPRIQVLGIHAHIGSQITSIRPYVVTLERVLKLVDTLDGQNIHLRYVDLGGGLGVRYRNETPPHPRELALELAKRLRGRDLTLLLEPGRYLVADAGVLLTRVLYRKHVGSKHFVIVDAAMNDLARPALYDAYHGVYPLQIKSGPKVTADIVGPVCESGDYLARHREITLPAIQDGIAIATAGAYGYVMSSQYNSRPRPPEVLVAGKEWRIIRERETVQDLMRGEHIPKDLR